MGEKEPGNVTHWFFLEYINMEKYPISNFVFQSF